MVKINNTVKERKSLLVAEAIKKLILEQDMEKLPAEYQLASMFQVSRTIVREALRVLELEGVTKTIHGSGTYVLRKNGLSISFNIPLKVCSDNPKDILELLEVRRCLESGAIKLAIQNASKEQLEELKTAFADLERSIESHEKLSEMDEKFHRKIFEIANNRILQMVFENLFSLLGILWHSPLGLQDFGDRGLPYHKELCDSIVRRDLTKALEVYEKIIDLDIEDVKDYVQKQGVKDCDKISKS
ncbi:FadR/GntR family transcriptional regulator [Pseudothermotoga sp.]|nr:FadR family transcriptional regulator [Pseudothermotoga sp.]MDW8139937.1 FadR/GntR family transcriptional regulator [Pseudothermotoga sp.]